MTDYTLGESEKTLFDAIRDGRPAQFDPDARGVIQAIVLRHIILGLPVEQESKGILLKAASLVGIGDPKTICPITGVGIAIENAVIRGRLDLDSIIGEDGGPICPLEFRGCHFEGGFSGRHAHFSRLAFDRSCFIDGPPAADGGEVPTVDLSGATIGSNLAMRKVAPLRVKPDKDGRIDRLWIRAIGARIDGEVDLSYAHLRAPREPRERALSEPPICALDLSLSRVGGDVQFLNGARSEGAIWARGAVIRGDVWMSGALIDGGEKYALFFQSAEIGGSLMLDGRAKDAARRGECETFRTYGQLNLNDLQVGGTLILSNALLRPPHPAAQDLPPAPAPAAAPEPVAGPAGDAALPDAHDPADADEVFCCLRLDDARIGDSVLIQVVGGERCRLYGQLYLAHLEVKNALTICDSYIGMAVDDPRLAITIYAPFLTARQVTIQNVEPLLWDEEAGGSHPEMMGLSINLEGARIDSLKLVDCWLNGCLTAPTLRCAVDVRLDARIGLGVDLSGAEIGGSLDISELRLDQGADGLDLRDATVSRTLNLTQRDVKGRSEEIRLVEARRVALTSLGSMVLLECLWRCGGGAGASAYLQTGFLLHGERPFLLDGKQMTFDSIVGHFGHSIVLPSPPADAPPLSEEDRAAAAEAERCRAIELVRLACAYVRSDKPGMMIASREDAAHFCGAAAAAPAQDSPATPFADLELAQLEPVAVAGPEGEFIVSGYCASGDSLAYCRFRLRTGVKPVQLKLLASKDAGTCAHPPVVEGQFLRRAADPRRGDIPLWVMPPTLAGMEPIESRELADFEAKLIHHVRSSCAIHGTANLTGLTCGLLDDNSGRAWGTEPIIPMNHFVYSRTTWIGADMQDPVPMLKSLWRSARVEAARRLPLFLTNLLGLNVRLRRSSRYCSGWQARLNWIYRQFDTRHLPSPSRYPMTQANYAPQPFEQAINVCRAEGREDYALHFEVEKQKIEWRLRNRRNRMWLAIVGLIAAALWLALTTPDEEGRWPVAAALAIGIASISYVASFALRYMFGYLRRPVRAIASLVAAFLIGWGGVHIANDRHLLVVDVEPVAGVAGRDQGRILMGSQNEVVADNWVRNVHCGDTISEGLYALDVLIPLIDLREESRCEVGVANDFAHRGPIKPTWIGAVFGSIVESERFWAAAKALYAIAGWFIVSLSILTFAQANRTRMDPP